MEFDPAVLASEEERVRQEHYRTHFEDVRKWPVALGTVVLSVVFVVITGYPDTPDFLALPLDVTLPVFGLFDVVFLLATWAGRRYGPLSIQHRCLEWLETLVTTCVGGVFVYASGSALSIWWFVPLAQVLQNLPFVGKYHWWTLSAHGLVFGPVAVGFYFEHGLAEALTTFAFLGILITIGYSAARFSDRLVCAEARENVVHRRLRELLVDRERERIARDLHDTIGANLTSIVWQARDLEDRMDLEALDDMVERVRDTLRQLRETVSNLRREDCSVQELAEELSARLNRLFGARAEIVLEVSGEGLVDGARADGAIRSIDEAVRNAAVHGAARRIEVFLHNDDDGLRVVIADDGGGADQRTLADGHGGLLHLRERVAEFGGTVRFESDARGTRAELSFPFEK
jgi:signal transduction histidine kinase